MQVHIHMDFTASPKEPVNRIPHTLAPDANPMFMLEVSMLYFFVQGPVRVSYSAYRHTIRP